MLSWQSGISTKTFLAKISQKSLVRACLIGEKYIGMDNFYELDLGYDSFDSNDKSTVKTLEKDVENGSKVDLSIVDLLVKKKKKLYYFEEINIYDSRRNAIQFSGIIQE